MKHISAPARIPTGDACAIGSVGLRSAELPRIQQPPAIYFTYARFARRIDDIGFYRTGNANIAAAGGVADAQRVTATWVTLRACHITSGAPGMARAVRHRARSLTTAHERKETT